MGMIAGGIGAGVSMIGQAVQGGLAAEAAKRQQAMQEHVTGKQLEMFGNQQDLAQQQLAQQRGVIQQYGEQGRGELYGGFQGASGILQPVLGLGAQYAPGATTAVGGRDITGARSRLAEMYDQGFQFNPDDPAYQARMRAGQEALASRAAATGGRTGTAADRANIRFAQDLASQEYGNQFQRQMQLAGGADVQQQGLLAQQAGMEQQAALAAQRNQAALAQQGFGAAGQLAGLRYGTGQDLSGALAGERAQTLAAMQQTGGTQRSLEMSKAGALQALVGGAGGELSAYANMAGNLAQSAGDLSGALMGAG
jgi:hypothetical protein